MSASFNELISTSDFRALLGPDRRAGSGCEIAASRAGW